MRNPILKKEMKVTMRSFKTVILISSYILIVQLLMLNLSGMQYGIYDVKQMSSRMLLSFRTIVFIQYIMIALIEPTIAANSISSEREKQTLDILLSTKLSKISIVLGKLFSSLSFILFLIICSVPLFAYVLFFGGVTGFDILMIIFYYICSIIFIGSLSVFFSTLFKKSITAIVLTYCVEIFLTLGLYILSAVYYQSIRSYSYSFTGTESKFILDYINPINGLSSIMGLGDGFSSLFYGRAVQGQSIDLTWVFCLIFYSLAAVGLIFLASRLLNPLKKARDK